MEERCPVCGAGLVEVGGTSQNIMKENDIQKNNQIEYYCGKCEIFFSLPKNH